MSLFTDLREVFTAYAQRIKSLTAADEEIKADLDDKVDLPSNGYGTSGKVLRSTGTGTEWATVGQPTDAQTAEAVTDWLNEHPEATTTVQDESITEPKLAPTLKKKITEGSLPGKLPVDVLYNKVNYDDYNIVQGGCIVNDKLVVAFTQESNDTNVKIREFNLSTFAIIREKTLSIVHAGSISYYNGNLYITDVGSTKKIQVVRYSDLTIIDSKTLPYAPYALCVNGEGQLAVMDYTDYSIKVYLLPDFTLVEEYQTIETELRYGTNQVDMEYYNGKYYVLMCAPATLYVYDDEFSLVKIIDCPERLDRISLMENEFIASKGDETFIIGWNTPFYYRDWYPTTDLIIETIFTVSDFKRGNSNNKEQNINSQYAPNSFAYVYVKADYAGNYSDGSWRYPYKEIQQAINDANIPRTLLHICVKPGTYSPVFCVDKSFDFGTWPNQSQPESLDDVTINSIRMLGGSASIGTIKLTECADIGGYGLRVESGGTCFAAASSSGLYSVYVTNGGNFFSGAYDVPIKSPSGIIALNSNTIRSWQNVEKVLPSSKILGRVGLYTGDSRNQTITLKAQPRQYVLCLVTATIEGINFTGLIVQAGVTVIPFEYYSGNDRIHGTVKLTSSNSTNLVVEFVCYKNSAVYNPSSFNMLVDGIL